MVLFFLSAALQYNDPDPVAWMLMWAAAGVVCLAYTLGRLPVAVALLVGLVALAWSLTLLPGIIQNADSIYWNEVFMQASMSNLTVEWVRELGGLLIIVLWMLVLSITNRKPS